MARLTQIVIDCRRPAVLARFWAAALDGFEIRPYDDAEIERLASMGRTPETDPCVIVEGPTLEICFQEVDVAPMAKRPLHLDISTATRSGERDRLVALGASVVQEFEHHTWMRDPRGQRLLPHRRVSDARAEAPPDGGVQPRLACRAACSTRARWALHQSGSRDGRLS